MTPDVSLRIPRPKNRRRGNKGLTLNGMLRYANKVYHVWDELKKIIDSRGCNKIIPKENILMSALMMFLLQSESMHAFFRAPLSREQMLLNTRVVLPKAGQRRTLVPGRDTTERFLEKMDSENPKSLLWSMGRISKRNRVFADNAIDEAKPVIMDGIKLHGSNCKKREGCCLSCTHRNGETEYFHKLVALTVPFARGGHQIITYELLKSRDPAEKDEGELTGAQRIFDALEQEMPGAFNSFVADALYDCAPIVRRCLEMNMWPVLRMKDESRRIYQQAEKLFIHGGGKRSCFTAELRKGQRYVVEVCWEDGFHMDDVDRDLRVMRFTEIPCDKYGKIIRDENGAIIDEAVKEMYILTASRKSESGESVYLKATTVWKLAHYRWDIENNCFHELSTGYHIKHLFSHKALEAMIPLLFLAYNIRELYLCRHRRRDFLGSYTRKDFTGRLLCNLLTSTVREVVCTDLWIRKRAGPNK